MNRTCILLASVLALAPACEGEKEVDPNEQAARIAKDLKEAETRLRNVEIKSGQSASKFAPNGRERTIDRSAE